MLHLSNFSLHNCYNEAKGAFNDLGINNADGLIEGYFNAKLLLYNLVEKIYAEVADSNPVLPEVWKMAKNKMNLDGDIIKVLKNRSWHELVPFAVESKSPEILEYIVNNISDSVGYEYVLRIISENKFINDKIKQMLLNSRLEARFKNKLIT